MRVHWLQHAEHEGLGFIGDWLAHRGHRVSGTRLHAGEPLPKAATFDWLIAMGGPMNVDEHDHHPWLAAEKDLINDACVMNKRYLGMCLGAQLGAAVLGGAVTKNPHQEIGWFDVTMTEEGLKSRVFCGFPRTFKAFHWHGDTFAVPPGATLLAGSEACANQAYEFDDGRIAGLQFHLEVSEDDAKRWLVEDPPAPGRYVQTRDEMLRDPARFASNHRLMAQLLDRMAR